jgi:predicted nuclease of restriction endonuclease-like (RecB) superfamily
MITLGVGASYSLQATSHSRLRILSDLTVGDREFATDLVFYHNPQRRFVVIELKIGEFDPEHEKGEKKKYND